MRAGVALVAVLAAALAPGAGGAATLDDLVARQRPGLWELAPASGAPLRYCVTDKAKLDVRAQVASALQGMGCRHVTDRVVGDRFELLTRCASPDPGFGTFEVRAKGTAGAERWRFAASVTGGGPIVQSFARSPGLSGPVEWRRLGACRPGDPPGSRLR